MLFAILLALVCIYQLSFTLITKIVEKDAVKYAQSKFLKIQADQKDIKITDKRTLIDSLNQAYLDSISGEVVYNFLGIRKYTFSECKEREINLGLDLKGGMNVTLEVSVIDLIKAMSDNSKDTTFLNAIALAKKYQKDSQEDFLTLFGRAFEDIDPNARLAAVFSTLDLKDRISYNSTNEEVLSVLRQETTSAIDNSINILRTRIDRFGVSQPNIQELGKAGRVLVELPGVKDPDRVRKLLQGTANLEFWETYENKEIYQYLLDANKRIKEIESASEDIEKAKKDSTLSEDKESDAEPVLLTKLDSSTADTTKQEELSLLEQLEKDTLTADTAQATPDQIIKDYPLFSILTPRTTREGQLLDGAAVGFSHFKDTNKVNKYLRLKQIKSLFPRDLKFLWTIKPFDEVGNFYELVAIKITSRDEKPALEGDVITNARAEFGESRASAEVSMSMNSEGAKVWARLTRENVGRQIAIVLDNYVYSYPVVQDEIKGGRSSITGNFSIPEAKDLANILKSGKLPAPARILNEEIVGPSLGHESINAGLSSFIIAFFVILLYMVFYYNKAGFVADIALIANIFFIIGVLASLGAALTLPGIAGIVLTIGMSVDANVLIYERIREELKAGKGLKLAINDGYKNAYSAIIDANVTTLLTGVVLYTFGTGPIKGFATTLVIGILTSLFAAIFLTRLIFTWLLDKNKKITFATRITENAFKNINFNFLKKRKIFYAISVIVILIGLVSLFSKGLNYGVDFKGGRSYIVRFKNDVSTVDIQKSLKTVYGEVPEVKTFGGNNQVKITTKYLIEESNPETDKIVETKLYEGLKSTIGKNVSFDTFIKDYRMSSQKVMPSISDDIKFSAVLAILFSLIFIFLYIFIRFKNWRFGLGAITALFHDVLILLGIFSILYGILPFTLEINQAFIAAILTVIGYSINDTVVVFDRIREYTGLYRKRERSETINSALNSTLSRTFSTSLSTAFVLLAIFIFGGEVIRGFIFAMLIGVLVGTYSSLFIATPVYFDALKKSKEDPVIIREKKKRK